MKVEITKYEIKVTGFSNNIEALEWALKRLKDLEIDMVNMLIKESDKSCPLYADYKKSCQALKDRNRELEA